MIYCFKVANVLENNLEMLISKHHSHYKLQEFPIHNLPIASVCESQMVNPA